jgi:hypothetical protein
MILIRRIHRRLAAAASSSTNNPTNQCPEGAVDDRFLRETKDKEASTKTIGQILSSGYLVVCGFIVLCGLRKGRQSFIRSEHDRRPLV